MSIWRMGVRVVVGAAADQVGAASQGLGEQRLRPGRPEDALLGEGAELEVDGGSVLALEGERLEALEPDDGIDLDVASHGRGAGAHGRVEHPPRAGADVFHREASLGLGGHPQRLGHRAFEAGRALREQRLVEVDVGVDQPRREHATAAVDPRGGPGAP